MAMSDWNDKKHGELMNLSTTKKYAGDKSLRTQCHETEDVIKILTQTETANPTNANISTWTYFHGIAANSFFNFCVLFRYQDLNNYYAAQIYYDFAYAKAYFLLRKKVSGTPSDIGTKYYISGLGPSWQNVKFELCEVSGTLHCTVYREIASSWVEQCIRSDSSPNWSGGGAIGVGAQPNQCNSVLGGYVYLDNTLIYY